MWLEPFQINSVHQINITGKNEIKELQKQNSDIVHCTLRWELLM